MFDSVRNNKRVVQLILFLIAVTFSLFGVESYLRDGGARGDAAEIGDARISNQEFERALRDQGERLMAAGGAEFDRAVLDTPEFREAVLRQEVNKRLLLLEAAKGRVGVSDAMLQKTLANLPAFQEDGRFSMQRYEAAVRSRGMSREQFEAAARQDLAVQQLVTGVVESGFYPKSLQDRWVAVQTEERMVSELVIPADAEAGKVSVTPEDVQKYFEAHRADFRTPEQVRIEYLVLSPEALAEQVAVSEDELRAWYRDHETQYRTPEERRASHILVAVAKDAPQAEVDKARAKAESLLKEVRANPQRFAEIAKANSDDPGSKAQGGDLGFFPREAMVKPFADAAFTLKEQQISDPVRSDFGWHIIRVTGIRAAVGKSFEDVKDEISIELRKQAASRKFAEAAETFSNLVYEQSDSLKPAAEKYGLKIRESEWISKAASAGLPAPINDARLVEALFAPDALQDKRNTEAIEVAQNTLVSARVVEHRPAADQTLEQVKPVVEALLRRDRGRELVRKAGEEKLAKLQAGETLDVTWTPARPVVRQMAQGPIAGLVHAMFRVPADKLPAYVGELLPNGAYGIYRIESVREATGDEVEAVRKAALGQLLREQTESDMGAYLGALRARYPVEINRAVLAKDKN